MLIENDVFFDSHYAATALSRDRIIFESESTKRFGGHEI